LPAVLHGRKTCLSHMLTVWKQGAEENIWAWEGWGNGRPRKTGRWGASWFHPLIKITWV